MPDLRHLVLGHSFRVTSIGELPVCDQLTGLDLLSETRYLNLEGLDRWTGLTSLSLYSKTHYRQLARTPSLHGLERLHLLREPDFDLRLAEPLTALRELLLFPIGKPHDLAPLSSLPSLTTLILHGEGIYDLTPLAACENLTVQLAHHTLVTGSHLFPPERIIRLP
ncbi:hypothetical protein LUR56_09580 [Streptomyces sp. MT29]|nr:hypothetical protein [Streptomyces sp. MT29]